MIADTGLNQGGMSSKTSIPRINIRSIDDWKEEFSVAMRDYNRSYLGMKPAPNGAGANGRRDLEDWSRRNDTCYSSIFQACKESSEAMMICKQYHRRKENAIPAEDQIARELMELLVIRFRDDTQSIVQDWHSKYNGFYFEKDETLPSGIDRLKGFVQQLTILGQEPTDESKQERIKAALAKSYPQLASILAMEDMSFEVLCTKSKRWWDSVHKNGEGIISTTTTTVTSNVNQPLAVGSGVADNQPILNAMFPGKCLSCHQYGHMARDCKRSKFRTCYLCRKIGHEMTMCPNFDIVPKRAKKGGGDYRTKKRNRRDRSQDTESDEGGSSNNDEDSRRARKKEKESIDMIVDRGRVVEQYHPEWSGSELE